MEPRLPGVFFTILLIGSVLGPLLGGRLSDLTGRRRMLLIFYGASALTTILFLAPLGIVSTRGRARWLFDFEYLWEVYKPAAKRRWGYYTLPILYGDRLVARLDPKLERATATVVLNGFWLEEHALVETPGFAAALARGLVRFAEFLGARRLNCTVLEPLILRIQVREYIGTALEHADSL